MNGPGSRATASPRIALVLGSGGVKSIAALGVAEVLEREGLRPDLIAGCSAGAIFGALLAMGLSTAEAAALATRLWSREVTSLRRRGAWLQLLLPKLAGFNPQFCMRDGRLIEARLTEAFGSLRLQDLPVPLRINATDAHTGAAVALDAGSVADALRASIALPFLFAPKQVGGQSLVDGSISDPLPVALAAHAKLVIAMGFNVPTPRVVDRPSRLATRVTASLSNNLMQARLDGHKGGRLISIFPALDRRVGLFDTDAMPYLIDLGRRSAEAALPQIAAALSQSGHVELAAA